MEIDKKICRMMNNYEARLRYNNLTLHFIIHYKNRAFEYNPISKEIRPFDSLIWYNLNSISVDNICKYLESLYYLINPFISTDMICTDIGTSVENSMVIKIQGLNDFVISDKVIIGSREFKVTNNVVDSKIIDIEYSNLITYLQKIYDDWYQFIMTIKDELL